MFRLAEDLEKFSSLMRRIIDLCDDYYIIEPMPETEFYFFVNEYYYLLQEVFPFKIYENNRFNLSKKQIKAKFISFLANHNLD